MNGWRRLRYFRTPVVGVPAPCPAHGPTDGEVDAAERAMAVDADWRRIVQQIPSRHLRGRHLERAQGFRLWLADEASSMRAVRYLEIGCRRGHSFALTCMAAGDRLERAVAVDKWIEGYGGEPNAGADQVRGDLQALGIDIEKTSFLTGDSARILPVMLAAQGAAGNGPGFNLILVDGDHGATGARRDLEHAIALLEIGGLVVFDDAYPASEKLESGLLEVWRETTGNDGGWLDMRTEELDADPPFCWARRRA